VIAVAVEVGAAAAATTYPLHEEASSTRLVG
jgi:hypothetical protein